jgi:hypothetical protein
VASGDAKGIWNYRYFSGYTSFTLIKKNQIFLMYKEIQMGSGAKSYMRKGFLICIRKCANFSPYMRRPLVIYDFAPDPSEFPCI